ncbi:MAG: C25 family cysteine peptidase [Pyrinomonadaceae bacterium]
MKTTISVALMLIMLVSACIPAFAQRTGKKGLTQRDTTRFATVEALSDGNGVLIRWEMAAEKQNVGFYVFRSGASRGELVNQSMVLGSSARTGDQAVYGETYQFFDPLGELGSTYYVESYLQGGRRIRSTVVATSWVEDLGRLTGQTSAEWAAAALSPNREVAASDMELHPELAQAVAASQQEPDLATHRWVVGQPGVKIGVRREGMYRVTMAELQAAGFPATSDSTKWRLFAQGLEQAIIVGPGDAYIEFYGKPIDTVESDTRVYYLIVDTTDGKRMPTKFLRPIAGNVVSNSYPVTAIKKERTSYVRGIVNGDAENYWGRIVSSAPTPVPFTLTGVEPSGDVTLTLKMQGYSQGTHLLAASVNGNALPQSTFVGQNALTRSFTIPATHLVEGANSIELTGLEPGHFSLFDSVAVSYKRRYQADQNRVSFFTPGYRKVELTGFSTANVRVFDTTHDGSPTLLVGLPIVQDGATFTATIPSSRNFVAYGVEDSGLLQSPSVTQNLPSAYSSALTTTELLIISDSTAPFLAAAETWANYRRGQGTTATVVDVADIFDEFSYGSASSASIKEFLSHLYGLDSSAVRYVLILGDGTYDPRNYEGFGYWNTVPTKFVSLISNESPSDEALADFDGDGLAEVAIGRIATRTAANVDTALNKTMLFETDVNRSLSRGSIFAHDIFNGFDFQGMSMQIRDELPPEMPAVFVDRASPTAQATLISEMNTGRFIINYSGHGSSGLWASSSFFGNNNVPDLTNASSPSIYTMLTCLNGYFVWPNSVESLGENLIKAQNGGAVAAWASSGETTPDIQLAMALRFYGQLTDGPLTRMGDLVTDAKSAIPAGADVRFSWVLLGDPMLKVK